MHYTKLGPCFGARSSFALPLSKLRSPYSSHSAPSRPPRPPTLQLVEEGEEDHPRSLPALPRSYQDLAADWSNRVGADRQALANAGGDRRAKFGAEGLREASDVAETRAERVRDLLSAYKARSSSSSGTAAALGLVRDLFHLGRRDSEASVGDIATGQSDRPARVEILTPFSRKCQSGRSEINYSNGIRSAMAGGDGERWHDTGGRSWISAPLGRAPRGASEMQTEATFEAHREFRVPSSAASGKCWTPHTTTLNPRRTSPWCRPTAITLESQRSSPPRQQRPALRSPHLPSSLSAALLASSAAIREPRDKR